MKSLIDRMVDRFLGWKLPANFGPDAGISFKPYMPQQTPESHLWPVGTNLFTADQARAMFEHAAAVDVPELSQRELDAIGHFYFNGPLNSNEQMFGREVERAVRRRLLGPHGVKVGRHQTKTQQTPMDLTQIPAEILQAERTLSEWFAQRNLSGWKLGGSQERVDEPAAGFTPCRLCRQIQRTVGWECSGQCNGEPK